MLTPVTQGGGEKSRRGIDKQLREKLILWDHCRDFFRGFHSSGSPGLRETSTSGTWYNNTRRSSSRDTSRSLCGTYTGDQAHQSWCLPSIHQRWQQEVNMKCLNSL